ncbi:MAG: nicotinate phosphoribosyltransferase [Clostridia bacterium]|nr:nicotinate phosphoribosyltransferase [Clostridia bacterium]
MDKSHLALLCDYYELTMMNGYYLTGLRDQITYFDVFFRSVPDRGGYAIFAGLAEVIDYIQNLRFDAEDIDFLRGKGIFSEDFLRYLQQFRFSGDLWAVPEGTPVFPNEPLLTVRAPAPEAQLLETYLLLAINHQSLIATKASRIARAAQGRAVLEFGARRAHGAHAAVDGARAAFIGGCQGTSCTLSDALYGVPAGGTMAHSWVQMFESEYEAFRTYCELYPNNVTLLVDTYDTLKSGVPNAIRAFRDVLLPQGITDCAIRLDSGDLAFISREARAMLDAAGLTGCKIAASNALDEWLIRDLLSQGACLDIFGVGERLITARSEPVFSGVYKLVAIEDAAGRIQPKIKISDNEVKILNPHFKKIFRIYDRDSGKALADQLCLHDEEIATDRPLTIFDPQATWKHKTLRHFTVRELLQPVFRSGGLVYEQPPLAQIRDYCAAQLATLWEETKRFKNPHRYYVDLSQRLWRIRDDLLRQNGRADMARQVSEPK